MQQWLEVKMYFINGTKKYSEKMNQQCDQG